jgi:hypothetical protein
MILLPPEVKLKQLPKWLPMGGITLGNTIYLKYPDRQWDLAHELTHIRQQKKYGRFTFYWRYVTSRKWRAEFEAEAYAEDVKYGLNIDELARELSGPLYLWPCSFDQAKQAIYRFAQL